MSVSKTLHTYIMPNFTIYFTRNVIHISFFSFCHLQLFGSVLWVPGWWGQHHVRNSRKIDQVQVINTLFAINFLTFPVGSWIPIIFFQFESGLIWIVLTVLLFEWILLLIFDLQARISKEISITRTFFSSHSRSSNFGNRISFLQKFNFLQITNLDFFPAVCMEPAVYLATLTTLDFCDSASKPHYSFVLSNRPCPLLSSSSNPMVTTRKAIGVQTR